MRKYFEYVPLWLSVVVNVILGWLVSFWVCIAGLVLFGMTLEGMLTGVVIFVIVGSIIVVVNLLLRFICMKMRKNAKEGLSDRGINVRRIIVLLPLLFVAFMSFIANDLWWLLRELIYGV